MKTRTRAGGGQGFSLKVCAGGNTAAKWKGHGMKKAGRIGRLVTAVGLSLSMALGGGFTGIALATQSDTPQSGETATVSSILKINKGSDNSANVKYNLYEIFTVDSAFKYAENLDANNDGYDDMVGATQSGSYYLGTIHNGNESYYIVTGLAWKDSETQTAVLAGIQKWATAYNVSDYPTTGATAQEVADFLNNKVSSTTNQQITGPGGENTRVNYDTQSESLMQYIALEVAKSSSGITPYAQNIVPGADTTINSQGYYLAITTDASTGQNTSTPQDLTGTSPMWMVLGAVIDIDDNSNKTTYEDVIIDEKTSVPTLTKQVLNDSNNKTTVADAAASDAWKSYADSQFGQAIWYKLTGTVSDNILTYDTYAYKFTDTLSAGLDMVTTNEDGMGVTVYVTTTTSGVESDRVNVPVSYTDSSNTTTTNWTPAYTDRVLTVEFTDLTALVDSSGNPITVDSTTKVYVYYQAKLNSNAVIAGSGNDNTATLTYSNNPEYEGTGTTEEVKAKDYAYALRLYKVDLGTEEALAGAVFTIQATNPDDTASSNLYVKTDGTLGTPTDSDENELDLANGATIYDQIEDDEDWRSTYSEYLFTTNADGVISVTGLDAGTYTISEVYAPDDYGNTLADDVVVTITPNYQETDNYLTSTSVTVTDVDSRDDLVAGLIDKDTVGDNVLQAQSGTETTTEGNVTYVTVSLGDVKEVKVPLTGQQGIALSLVAGAAILGLGIWRVRRSRQEDEA